MKTLAEINDLLGKEVVADLTNIIADIKAAVRASDAGVIEDLQKQLALLEDKMGRDSVEAAEKLAAANAKAETDLAAAKAECQKLYEEGLAKQMVEHNAASEVLAAKIAELKTTAARNSDSAKEEITALKQQLDTALNARNFVAAELARQDGLLTEARQMYAVFGDALKEAAKSAHHRAKEAAEKRKAELEAEIEKLKAV